MSDLVKRLRGQVGDDHVRGCQGRQYVCSCGYDLATEGLLEIAADRIEALEAALALLVEHPNVDNSVKAFARIALAPEQDK